MIRNILLGAVCFFSAAGAACGEAEDGELELGTTEQAFSVYNLYGRGQSPSHPSTDNRCYSDTPTCYVPTDRVLSFKPDYGVPSYVFANGLFKALSYVQATVGPLGWTVNQNGTRNAERIFLDPNCGVLAREEASQLSGTFSQNGRNYRKIGASSIRVCLNHIMSLMVGWSEQEQIRGIRNVLVHEIGHTIGLAHNPNSTALGGSPLRRDINVTFNLTEQTELLNYTP